MDIKDLKVLRERPQSVTNILGEDFDFKWDGIDYTIKKGETKQYAYYLAEHCALHMARRYATEKNKNYITQAGKIVDEIMGKKFIEYDKLTIEQAKEICEEREISVKDEEGKKKNKATLISDLKKSH